MSVNGNISWNTLMFCNDTETSNTDAITYFKYSTQNISRYSTICSVNSHTWAKGFQNVSLQMRSLHAEVVIFCVHSKQIF